MNKLTILTIIFSAVAYCAAIRNCSKTYADTELYTTAINVKCSDELNRFTNVASYLVNNLTDIHGGDFMLKSQVKLDNAYSYLYIRISSYICMLLIYRQMLLIITA